MESEGEIDTCYEITLDKLKSNLNEVDLPSDSELILAGVLTDNFKSYDEALEFAKKTDLSCLLFTDDEGDLTVYSQRLDYKYLGCIIYDRNYHQKHPDGSVSYSPEYRCEIWLMK